MSGLLVSVPRDTDIWYRGLKPYIDRVQELLSSPVALTCYLSWFLDAYDAHREDTLHKYFYDVSFDFVVDVSTFDSMFHDLNHERYAACLLVLVHLYYHQAIRVEPPRRYKIRTLSYKYIVKTLESLKRESATDQPIFVEITMKIINFIRGTVRTMYDNLYSDSDSDPEADELCCVRFDTRRVNQSHVAYCCHLQCLQAPGKLHCTICKSPTFCYCDCVTYQKIYQRLEYCCHLQCFKEPFWGLVNGVACTKCNSVMYCRCNCKMYIQLKLCLPQGYDDMHEYEKRLKSFQHSTLFPAHVFAKNGFSYVAQSTKCYACDITLCDSLLHFLPDATDQEWEDTIVNVHKTLSPYCPVVRRDPRIDYYFKAKKQIPYRATDAVKSLLARNVWLYTTDDIVNEKITEPPEYCCEEKCFGLPRSHRWCQKCKAYGNCMCKCLTYCCVFQCFKEPEEQVDGMACVKCQAFSYCRCECNTYQFNRKRWLPASSIENLF